MNEQKMAILTVHRGAQLNRRARAFIAAWLREKADEIESGADVDDYAPLFRASVWSGHGLGWMKKRHA